METYKIILKETGHKLRVIHRHKAAEEVRDILAAIQAQETSRGAIASLVNGGMFLNVLHPEAPDSARGKLQIYLSSPEQ